MLPRSLDNILGGNLRNFIHIRHNLIEGKSEVFTKFIEATSILLRNCTNFFDEYAVFFLSLINVLENRLRLVDSAII